MWLVLHQRVLWKIEDASERVPDAGRARLVGRRTVPNAQMVLGVLGAERDATYLLSDEKLLAQHGHAHVLPRPVDFILPQTDDPFAAFCIRRVLPHWFDAALCERNFGGYSGERGRGRSRAGFKVMSPRALGKICSRPFL